MVIHQISVFIENRQGRLKEFTRMLGEKRVDLIALSIADTTNFGILRAIVPDTQYALKVIREANFAASLTEVLAVAVPDKPGGLAEVLDVLDGAGIFVEYLYSFVRNVDDNAVIIFRVDKVGEAIKALEQAEIPLLTEEEVRNL